MTEAAGRQPGDRVATPHFDGWLDRFFATFWQQRPVDASAVGVREHDGHLPDLSAPGIEERASSARSLLADLAALPEERLDFPRAADLALAAGVLEMELAEVASGREYQRDPTHYTGAAAFGFLSLLRYPAGTPGERLDHLRSRAGAVPELFASARKGLTEAPVMWIERAVSDCRGVIALATRGVPRYLHDEGLDGDVLKRPLDEAAAAAAQLIETLERLSLSEPSTLACGSERLALIYRVAHAHDQTLDETEAFGWSSLEIACARLEDTVRTAGAADSADALARLALRRPTAETYLDRHRDVFDQHRTLAVQRGLLTWPDFPIEYRMTPTWLDEAGAHLLIYPYHAPPSTGVPERIAFFAGMLPTDPDAASRFFAQHHDSVIKLNHVIHHGGMGHHVQNWYAYHCAESRVGHVAAIDNAGRTVMLCGTTMAEGWASDVVHLMDDAGMIDPLERTSIALTELRAAARLLVDVRLHSGLWSPDEAMDFLETESAMDRAGAGSEVTRMTLQPGVGGAYLLGTAGIQALRAEYLATPRGAASGVGDFHDQLLSLGSVPVAMASRELLARVREATDASP